MAHLGVFCPPTFGHLNPMMAVGRALQVRGHRVTFLNFPHVKSAVRERGFEFLSLSTQGDVSFDVERAYGDLSRKTGLTGVLHTVKIFSATSAQICNVAPALIRAADIDGLLVDQYEMGGAAVADHLKIPFVTVCCALAYHWEPGMPPVNQGWFYDNSWWGRWRSLASRQLSRYLSAPILKTANIYRYRWNLRLWTRPNQPFSRWAQIAQNTAAFDFPRRQLPQQFHYAGLFQTPDAGPKLFPWDRLNGKPLVYASLGTLQTGNERFYRIIAEACAAEEVQLVLSTGGRPVDSLGRLAGDTVAVSFAPQIDLLKSAELTVTHGGLNTVLESLSQAVPMVAIPMTNDQPGVAARIVYHGLGEVIRPSALTPERLRATIRRVRTNPSYRERARLQQKALRDAGGAARAADIIEDVLKIHAPLH